ncbi:MAG TPA: AsmA family protein [Candidatus Sulfotelmatobacter sp.]|nr:AsmA family protein [Candidatus Sulfotelmatobacter sp.]
MKRILKVLAIIVGILIVIVVALPFLIDVNTFRPKLESELGDALGRQVKVGNLSLSLLSGGVTADEISIADDPAFSKTPFVQAKSLKVGVELMPLIFSKKLNVTEITLDQPEINLVKSENGEKWNFSSLGGQSPAPTAESKQPEPKKAEGKPAETKPAETPAAAPASASNPNVSVAKLNVNNGRLTVSRVGSPDKARVYDKVNIEVTNFSFTSSFPFKVSASLPGGGSLTLDGKAGPVDASNAALTPLDAKVSVQHFSLAESGFVDPASGISGIADLDETLTSDGHEAKTNGTLKATELKVAQKGSPAGRPVQLTYAVVHDLVKQAGTITQGDIAMGKAVAHLTGTYDARGKVTAVNLKLNGPGMPVDDLEAMLPALGVVLPPKASLKGGALNTNLAIVGPVDKLVTTGTIRLENSSLANFDLGSKLSSISALAGKKTGNDTTIQNFSSDVRVAPEGTRADNINLNVPSIGVLTGAGTVSPANELAFKMKADLAGMGIPFGVEGTTSDPKFVPDVKGMATGLLKGVLGGKSGAGQNNPLGGLTGLFKKKP